MYLTLGVLTLCVHKNLILKETDVLRLYYICATREIKVSLETIKNQE